jgi:hypothetical protein
MKLETNERKQKSGTHEPDVVSSNLSGPISQNSTTAPQFENGRLGLEYREVESSNLSGPMSMYLLRILHVLS